MKLLSRASMADILLNDVAVKKSITIPACGYVLATIIYGVSLQEVHAHSKELRPLHRGFEVPILVTVADLVAYAVLFKLESLKELKRHAEGIIVSFLCQVAADYLFNYWYIYSRQDAFAVGYFEPIVLILLLKWCTRLEVNLKILATLVLLSLSAGLTSGDVFILSNLSRNGIIIFLVTYFISLRNLGVKLLQEESLNIRIRKSIIVPFSAIILSTGFILSAFHLTYWALPVMFALVAMFASVAMFYCSMVLLENCSLISVSVLGLVAQICVNFACVPGEHAHNVLVTVFALAAIGFGIVIYFRYMTDTTDAPDQQLSKVAHHEIYTRMEFLIFTGCVCGILFYVFHPKLSKRDLNNLHYVGLDKLVKRLLNKN